MLLRVARHRQSLRYRSGSKKASPNTKPNPPPKFSPKRSFIDDIRETTNPGQSLFGTLNSENAIADTKDLLAATKKKYFDPSNLTLDFGLPNHLLFSRIMAESRTRAQKRLGEPNDKWMARRGDNIEDIVQQMQKHLRETKVSLHSSLSSLGVGDLVLLSHQSTVLNIVAAAPKTLDSNMYTFVNHEGEISYGPKFHIILRIPQVLPKKFVQWLEMISLEQKHAGIAPIGIPDSKFSRSALSLPVEIQKDGALQARESSSGSFQTLGDDFIVAQAASQLLTDTDVKTFVIPTKVRLLYSSFLIAESISSFKKVTSFSNKLEYFHKVLQYDENNNLIDSARTIPLFELFDLISNFPQILKLKEKVKGSPGEFRAINSHIRNIGTQSSTKFGKSVPESLKEGFADCSHSMSSYIAFIVALARSGRMWKLNMQKSTKTPISVDILPLKKSLDIEQALGHLKNRGTQEFAEYYAKKVQKKDVSLPKYYEATIQMFKDFVSSNISDDHTMESVLGNLIRNVDLVLEREKLTVKQAVPYSFEYSKSRAFEIVTFLENEGWVNPMKWSESLKLAHTKTSTESDLYAEFFQFADSMFKNKEQFMWEVGRPKTEVSPSTQLTEFDDSLPWNKNPVVSKWLADDFHSADPVESVREDFENVPVYCIDSATAHEIDDGISIQMNPDNYVITVHVANPTSYIKQKSILGEIAFSKGTTVYLPEGPSMMLPQIVSKVCGLNGTEETTRTFAIQFDLNRELVDEYVKSAKSGNAKPGDTLAREVLSQLGESVRVKFFNVSDFPKGFTYEKVNEILGDASTVEAFANDHLREGSHELNLFMLYHISSILKHVRCGLGRGLDFSRARPNVKVDYVKNTGSSHFKEVPGGYELTVPGEHATTPKITITKEINQNRESKSQQLVSNFMITANYAGSVYAQKNNIPIIHRTQELNLEKSVEAEVMRLNKQVYETGRELTVEEQSLVFSVVNSANYEVTKKNHESLGLDVYLNFTSPLRRFVDMVNHWKFEEFALGQAPETPNTDHLDYVASHLQSCDFVSKGVQRFLDKFWQGSFLKHYFELLAQKQIEKPIAFDFLLLSDAKFGDVRMDVMGFDNVSASIVQNDYVLEKFANDEFRVGMVLKNPRFRVSKIDFIEDEFAVELF